MKNNANLPGGSAAAFIATLLLAFGLISYVNPQSSYVLFGNVVFHLPQWDPLGERSGSDGYQCGAGCERAIGALQINTTC